MNRLSAIIPSLLIVSCATSSNRTKTLELMGASLATGIIVGQARSGDKRANSIVYGSVFAAAAALAGLYYFDDQKKIVELKQDNDRLKIKLQERELPVLTQGESLFSAPLPKEVSNLIQPGKWRKYKLDQWIQDHSNENIWYRQTEMFEVIPPTLSQ